MLDGPTLAAIFLGNIKTWDDAAIKKLNPDVKLPAQPIAVVHRSDGSGTTFNLHRLSFEGQPGLEEQGRRQHLGRVAGRASAPRATRASPTTSTQTKGAIGYVEYAYAKQNKLTTTKHDQQGRQGGRAECGLVPGCRRQRRLELGAGLRLDPRQPAGRRVLADGWRDVHPRSTSSRNDPAATAEALKFFAWAYAKGDKMAEELDYVPMPNKVVDAIEKVWASEIKDASGKPLYTAMAQ